MRRVSIYLGVNSAHLSRFFRGYLSPTLYKALVEKGLVPAPPKRYRRAADFTADRVAQFDQMLEALGMSFTDWANAQLDEWLNELDS